MLVLFGILFLLMRQFRASESLEISVAALARYPMDNVNPVLTISAAGNFEFMNPSAVRLLDSFAGTHSLDRLKQELFGLAKQSRAGISDLSLENMILQVSTVPKENGASDFYLTDVTVLRSDESILNLFYKLPFLGMAVTSPITQEWVTVNDELCEILGYSRDELTSLTWSEITHPDDLETDLASFNSVLAGDSEGYRMDKRFIRRDRATIHATIDVRVVRKPAGEIEFFVATIQDITARKRTESALRLQKNLYAALLASNHAIARMRGNREEIFQQICQAAVEHAGFLFAWIGEVDTASGLLKPVAWFGNDDGYVGGIRVSTQAQDPLGEGPTGRAVRAAKPLVVLDIEHDETVVPWKSDLLKRGVSAFASFPIVNGRGVFGTF